MNNIYSFILGHSSKISYAEILSFLRLKNIDFDVLEMQNEFLICKIKKEFDATFVMKELGGTIKIGKLEFQLNKDNCKDSFCETFLEYIKRNYDTSNKLKIGFSFYNISKDIFAWFVKETMHIKRKLENEGIRTRIISSKKKDLSAVIVKKENLLSEKGIDMQVLQVEEKIYFSKTIAVQDFEHFGKIDYGRPKSDSRSGMMPPKLAKIMLNLSGSRKNIYDPFCGSGTILMMAGELEYEKIIGSDISEKAVLDSKENIEWYENTYDKDLNCEIFQKDIVSISSHAFINTPSVVVTEGYLGQPLHGNESLEFIQKQIKSIEELYLKSFKAFFEILEEGAVVVISFPVFVYDTKLYYLDILDKIKNLGFFIQELIDKKYLGKRGTLIYKREDQKVYREIIKLIKNSE